MSDNVIYPRELLASHAARTAVKVALEVLQEHDAIRQLGDLQKVALVMQLCAESYRRGVMDACDRIEKEVGEAAD